MPTSRTALLSPVVRSSPHSTRCAVIECHKKRGHGLFGTMCKAHAEMFAQFREELASRKTIYGQRQDQRPKSSYTPRCTNPACDEPRPRGKAFCGECEAVYGAAALPEGGPR